MKNDPEPLEKPARGRPRSFDRTEALDKALALFWKWGYEGTSISALTDVMGITPPSLYTAFGSKEALFFEAVDRYNATYGDFAARALAEEPTARGAMARLLEDAAAAYTVPHTGHGCLVICAATNCTPASSDVQNALRDRRVASEGFIRDRIARAIEEGELDPGADADALAKYFAVVIQGMSVQARDGTPREALVKVARLAMSAWPAPKKKR